MKALLDTSFFIRLLKAGDPLQGQAQGYLEYFLNEGVALYISTIAISEFCVKDRLDALPFQFLCILPFNTDHAEASGRLYAQILEFKASGQSLDVPRNVVPNDCKMFAQAHVEKFDYFVSSDSKANKLLSRLGDGCTHFRFIDISKSVQSEMGVLF